MTQLSFPPSSATVARFAPAVPAALLAGWTSASIPFFPAHWSAGLAVAAALLSFAGPRLGLTFALAVPVLPLGNIALGLAILYGVVACLWLALFWTRPRAALLFVLGPVLAPLGALGLLPLVLLAVGGAARRAAQAAAAVLAAAVVAGLSGHSLPVVGGAAPRLGIDAIEGPLAAGAALWRGLVAAHGLLPETLALAAVAAAIGACRRRGLWGAAAFGALLMTATLLADPSVAALPFVVVGWISAGLLALEHEQGTAGRSFSRLLRRISHERRRLRPAAES